MPAAKVTVVIDDERVYGEKAEELFEVEVRADSGAEYYLRLRERGMSSTAALVALSRKPAKVSFALLRTNTRFVPAVPEIACAST